MASFKVYVEVAAKVEVRALPGHIRQRASRAIQALGDEARPPGSRALDVEGIAAEVRRLRIDRWRIVYTVDSEWREIVVYAVRKRPPYNYEDLDALLRKVK